VRYWTVDEAQAFLPRLRLLLGVIRRASHLAVSAKANGHAVLPGAPLPVGPLPTEPGPTEPTSPESGPADAGSPDPGTADLVPPGSGTSDAGPARPGSEPAVAFDVKEALAELEQQGIVLRDPARGLIDFTALHHGREVLLCWQLGEDELAWWHYPEDGFAGRRPLPLPPDP
jgi:hypothetical protein